jgi:hypothetical protein
LWDPEWSYPLKKEFLQHFTAPMTDFWMEKESKSGIEKSELHQDQDKIEKKKYFVYF